MPSLWCQPQLFIEGGGPRQISGNKLQLVGAVHKRSL